MLVPEKKLSRKKDFDTIYKKGKSFRGNLLLLKFIPNNLQYNRLAFVVSQKVSKSAVKRNRIRRILKELIGKNLNSLKNNIDGLLIVSPGFNSGKEEELKKDVIDVFKKARLL